MHRPSLPLGLCVFYYLRRVHSLPLPVVGVIYGREVGAEQHDALVLQISELQGRVDVLLELLGEKEEEIEDVKQELRDAKETYGIQLEELMTRLTNRA